MDPPRKCGLPNPLAKSRLFTRLVFGFVENVLGLTKGSKMTHKHVYTPPPTEETFNTGRRLNKQWQKEVENHKAGRKASLTMALIRAFGLHYALCGIPIFIEDACRFAQPIIFRYLIEYFSEDTTMSQQTALLLAMGIAVCSLLQAFVGPQIVFWLVRSGMRWQGGVADLLYRKVLKLPSRTLSDVTTGHIVDLMSSDSEKLDWVVWFLHVVWQAPVHTVLCTVLIYYELGVSVFSGLGVIFLLLPLQGLIAWAISKYREKNYDKMDERVSMMSEIIGGMRVIKMYCWEKPFGEVIDFIRRLELRYLWRADVLAAILQEMYTFNSRLLTAVIVVVYVATNNTISAAKVFPMFALFNILSESLLNQLPWGIKTVLEVRVSVHRLQKFLLLKEIGDEKADKRIHDVLDSTIASRDHPEPHIKVTGMSATWTEGARNAEEESVTDDSDQAPLLGNEESPNADIQSESGESPLALDDVSFEVKGKSLLAIIGPVGSSKSSLLLSLLGELRPRLGSVDIAGSPSYAAQQPWVFTSTIRQNIIFGRVYDPDRYADILNATALTKDLSLLPHGDLSLVGEKGVTLSGGQKARVSLARALYADADILLLDDPLSAVDAKVGRHLFDRCINGYLKDKMRILVTHQSQFLKDVEKILVLDKGKVKGFGSYRELKDAGFDLEHIAEDDTVREEADAELHCDEDSADIVSLKRQLSKEEQEEQEDEDRVEGKVSWGLYLEYFRSGANICVVLLILLMCIITQAAYNLSDVWLSLWSNAESTKGQNMTNTTVAPPVIPVLMDTYTSVAIYLGITGATLVVGLTKTWTFKRMTNNAARTLHNRMYNSVIRSPVRFYDANPKGRILNRFSGDIDSASSAIPNLIMDFTQYFFIVLGNLVVIVISSYWTVVPVIPLLIAVAFIRTKYIRTQRDVQRVISESHSPVLSHLNSTLEGIQTIRAFGAESQCLRDFREHYDVFYGAWFTDLCVFGWFQFRVNLLGALFNAASVFTITLLAHDSSPGVAGLTLSYIMPMLWYVESAARLSAEMEIEMVKLERVVRYTKLRPEAELTSADPPPEDWPQRGGIVFDKVSFAYHEKAPLVLKDLDITISPGAKVGIVGRTGAGKSSIIQALFRMSEPYGQIRIDGLPISHLGLHELRAKLSIIPQDPVLFKGTVRTNLDPFHSHSDEEIWKVLDEVQLRSMVSDSPGRLEGEVTEGGGNFSVGQKQLFCLGRAILRHNKILIIDEATANVDKKTDELVQMSIRRKFSSCTVLTIAHRLNTVMDSDKILVMDEGKAVEYDSPYRLLQDPQSQFYQMLGSAGSADLLHYAALHDQVHHGRVSQIDPAGTWSTARGSPAPTSLPASLSSLTYTECQIQTTP